MAKKTKILFRCNNCNTKGKYSTLTELLPHPSEHNPKCPECGRVVSWKIGR